MYNFFQAKMGEEFTEESNVFLTNCAQTTRYPYVKMSEYTDS